MVKQRRYAGFLLPGRSDPELIAVPKRLGSLYFKKHQIAPRSGSGFVDCTRLRFRRLFPAPFFSLTCRLIISNLVSSEAEI